MMTEEKPVVNNSPPALIVSATHSGAGKTTITRALLAALKARGLIVQHKCWKERFMGIRKISLFHWAFPLLLVLWSCSGGGDDTNGPSNYKDIPRDYKNLPYGKAAQQVLDLHYPKAPNLITEQVNALVLIHGGSWIGGDKEESFPDEMVKSLSEEAGVVVANINYRTLLQFAYVPEMLDDVNEALRLVKQKSGELGVQIHRVGILGHSAGGHLALLYSYKTDDPPIPIDFTVGLAAPSDLTDPALYPELTIADISGAAMLLGVSYLTKTSEVTPDISAKLNSGSILSVLPSAIWYTNLNDPGVQSKLQDISPVSYVTANSPRTLLYHSKMDKIVNVHNSVVLEKALQDANVPVEFVAFDDSNHSLEGKQTLMYARVKEYLANID
jgi:acetyl esterase/lipase